MKLMNDYTIYMKFNPNGQTIEQVIEDYIVFKKINFMSGNWNEKG